MTANLPPAFDHDHLWPRDERHRYRIYAVVEGDRTVLATTDCAAGVGLALVTIHEDQKSIGRRLCDHGRIGVLDVMPDGRPHPRGEWIVQPYDRSPA